MKEVMRLQAEDARRMLAEPTREPVAPTHPEPGESPDRFLRRYHGESPE